MYMPEYVCNAAIVAVEHKSYQTTEPWEKGQRQRWERVQLEAKEGGGWISKFYRASKRTRQKKQSEWQSAEFKKTYVALLKNPLRRQ